ncbi:RNA-binding protein [Planococcus shenhongbingii]|uniref:RNA-binding protein n=1 Tax=Planococcus shenhongbingii TaxID=3058398 RepID=A0ABT8N8R9_9BACL|nr:MULTISPECIES: RNA-binding protein [unclassified Planococcus (in: firmicutes)]MDN7244261.1 RNA-binding protein [Planococcus sp. N017]WKA57430.1 RNA-binding protein [Planococcus sp. N016]
MDSLFQHFRKDEQPFIEQVAGWMIDVEDRYTPKLTDFLDPRQRFIVTSVIGGSNDIQMAASGLFKDAERQRVLLYPSYYEVQKEDFQITVFELNYPTKFVTLQHPDILGSMMSIGLDRSKYGDIRIKGQQIQIAVADEVSAYLQANFTTAAKVKVHLEEVSSDSDFINVTEEWTEESHTVSSLRLDTVISSVYNISRQKAAALISGGKVKVNWTVQEQPAFELNESDMISSRGYGRVKMVEIEGRTKKDKIRLLIGRLENNK